VAAVLTASDAQAQHHGMPQFCDGGTVVRPGQTLTLTNQRLSCVRVEEGGRVVLAEGANAAVGTLQVLAGGALEGASDGLSATLTILDQPLDLAADPEQFGTGLLVLGRLTLHGVPRTPFVGLAAEARSGQMVLTLNAEPVGWRAGDRLVLPDTRHLRDSEIGARYVPQWEESIVAGVSGPTVTLVEPLAFDHLGARNPDGELQLLPHVANLTRSIVIRSANPAGTRGHILATERAAVDMRYVGVEDMGRTTAAPLDCTLRATGALQEPHRCEPGTGAVTKTGTNHIGRYPVHFHHLDGPPNLAAEAPQFTLVGSAIVRSRKWPVAVHNSHYGLVQGNVLYGWEGAGLMTEDGSETGNVIEANFSLAGTGQGGRDAGGREGVGFYFRGPNNHVRNNVAANILPGPGSVDAAYGYKYFLVYVGQNGLLPFPAAKGSAERIMIDAHTLPVAEFSNNEVYGATESGLTYWWIGAWGTGNTRTTARSTFHNLRVWHVHNRAVFNYESALITIDGLVVRGGNVQNPACCGQGIQGADYWADEWIIRNADIQGMDTGIWPSHMSRGTQIIEDSILRNWTNVVVETPATSSYRADGIPSRSVLLRNVRLLEPPQPERGRTYAAIATGFIDRPVRNLIATDEIVVEDYQGDASDDFRVYYRQQAPTFILPQTIPNPDGTPSLLGSPEPGLTNAEAFAKHRIAVAGAVATCADTRPAIVGFVCAR
jgi:hypothetical protein